MLSRQPNRLREIIRQGEIALGTCLYSFSPALIELAGFCGLDFCRIDNEHAWRQDQTTEDVLRGGLLAGLVPLLRVDRDNPYLIRKAFEAGAGSIALAIFVKNTPSTTIKVAILVFMIYFLN